MKATMAAFVGLVMTVSMAACDSGGERLTEEEFVTQANAACEDGNQAIQEAAEEIGASGQQPSEDQLEGFVAEIVVVVQDQIDEINGLSPPEDLEQDVNAMIEELQSSLDELEAAGAAALQSQENPFAEANEMAGDLGLDVCAEG